MNLIKDYINKLKKLENIEFHNFSISDKLIHYISDSSLGNLYEDLVQIDFNALYPNILVGLFESNLLDEKWKDDIGRVKWFLENRKGLKRLKSDEYQKWKVHCNSLYMKIKSPYVVEYMNLFYSDLLSKYRDKIIYIDVDLLILNLSKLDFQREVQIPEINHFNYDVSFINYFYTENLKQYIKQDEYGEIVVSGFKDPKKEKLQSIIKTEIRRRKLENLGIN